VVFNGVIRVGGACRVDGHRQQVVDALAKRVGAKRVADAVEVGCAFIATVDVVDGRASCGGADAPAERVVGVGLGEDVIRCDRDKLALRVPRHSERGGAAHEVGDVARGVVQGAVQSVVGVGIRGGSCGQAVSCEIISEAG